MLRFVTECVSSADAAVLVLKRAFGSGASYSPSPVFTTVIQWTWGAMVSSPSRHDLHTTSVRGNTITGTPLETDPNQSNPHSTCLSQSSRSWVAMLNTPQAFHHRSAIAEVQLSAETSAVLAAGSLRNLTSETGIGLTGLRNVFWFLDGKVGGFVPLVCGAPE
ncbi:hypothetical protein BDV96DRAFT_136721 [Lophiotrema nucula]|uniref:Uncharacterized protein n=1 Tax=Lophiotrema nucula TaxID=690887 RepID=A0A6A5ZQT1_9PLEO|nr:hypothetical protein BDV96DRAFT_136721 [Lophiotrema nucula]